jgi:hypothetical protein
MFRGAKLFSLILFVAAAIPVLINSGEAQKVDGRSSLTIPKTWDDLAIDSIEVPLADPGASPAHVRSDFYYRIPVHKIYKSYPIYPPDKEPPGYIEWLKQQVPQVIDFNPSKFKTEDDWIKAGEMVFDEPFFYENLPAFSDVRDPAFYEKTGVPIARDGTMPFARYVIREKGKVEVGNLSCAICHTRVMPDGTVVKGAQGNFPFEKAVAFGIRRPGGEGDDRESLEHFRTFQRALFAAPWLQSDPHARIGQMSFEELALAHEAIPPGVIARQRAGLFYPAQVPDLISIKERRYLDRTGLIRHNSIADLMRYAALTQTGDDLARFGKFVPFEPILGKSYDANEVERYSDEQLYALALYIYSLKPPPNPNKFDALAALGKKVFEREGCVLCHTPPLYTNNKLTIAEGFNPPEDHFKKYDILPLSVGTDPNLALKTRRGTGYYKVPSLKGVWYRGPFEHSGSVATLEDWFDPRRTKPDYVPTGFRGYTVKTRAVSGHSFGLSLSEADRKALIAFLKTL